MAHRTHGMSDHGDEHPLYQTWTGMKNRCTNPRNRAWRLYGGRGIKVCDRWMASFLDFISDVGERPPGTTLDRIDNDGNYEPGNVRWATSKQQSGNRRNHAGEANGFAKLTTRQVLEIRRRYAAGARQTALAAEFNTCQANVSLIVRNESRKRG